ncbi:putative protein YqgN [bioreactor metagenome]|uniref:5-formyltetrahydrofolate cyclo-ligase n=1 Tax=bioreactor metagenome TaxID=1076179 RepID=A0A645DMD5_9ZZZZ
MDFYAVKSENELEPGLFGIPEPTEICPVITNPSGALCVTPAVVAGCDGRRLGYGGGYYDRFFAKFNVTVLCAIFEKQLVPAGNIPEGIYDVRFDILVTERSTIRP